MVRNSGKLCSGISGKVCSGTVVKYSPEYAHSRSTQLDAAIPPSKIASLSSGEFVGMVADDPDQKIQLKIFHNEILNNHEDIRKEEEGYGAIPMAREISQQEIQDNYFRIKEDIRSIIEQKLTKAA